MKKTIILAAALVAMVGCNKSLIESPVAEDADYGYINLGVTTDSEMVITKAISTSADLTGYNFTLMKDAAVVSGWPKEFDNIKTEDWKVPAATYTVYAENLSADEVYTEANPKGQVRIAGQVDVTVLPGVPTTETLALNPINSKVSFLYTEDFATVFNNAESLTVNVKNSDKSHNFNLSMAKVVENQDKSALDAAYFDPGTLTWTLTATNANNAQKTYTKDFAVEANEWTLITFTTGDTNGTINVTVTVNGDITATETITAVLDPTTDNGITIQ